MVFFFPSTTDWIFGWETTGYWHHVSLSNCLTYRLHLTSFCKWTKISLPSPTWFLFLQCGWKPFPKLSNLATVAVGCTLSLGIALSLQSHWTENLKDVVHREAGTHAPVQAIELSGKHGLLSWSSYSLSVQLWLAPAGAHNRNTQTIRL